MGANATFAGMPRTLAIDYGAKRSGLAISDPLGMIANGLDTALTSDLLNNLQRIHKDQGFTRVVVGQPKRMSGEASEIERAIQAFLEKFSKAFPQVEVIRWDERFTSKLALDAMITTGATKKQRSVKGNIDKVSATLILQEFLNQ